MSRRPSAGQRCGSSGGASQRPFVPSTVPAWRSPGRCRARPARAVPDGVTRLLAREGRERVDRHLRWFAVQVALEAPGLRARRHDPPQQAAAIGQVVALVLRLRLVDRRGLRDVVDLSQAGGPRWRRGRLRGPECGPTLSGVKKQPETPESKNPSRINDLGFRVGPSGTSEDASGPAHMWSIITCPKPEHDTWVAPSISRAKS